MARRNESSQLTPKTLSTSAQSTVREILGSIHEVELLSQTHNIVYMVVVDRGRYVVKEIHDPTIDVHLEKSILQKIPSNDLFRPILHIQRLDDTGSSLAIAPYIEGTSLDSFISQGRVSVDQGRLWANDLHRIFQHLRTLPAQGFGKPTLVRGPGFDSWTSFLAWYLKRQKEKGPRLAKMRFKQLLGIFESLSQELDSQNPIPRVINGDTNARNFLVVSPTNRLCQIHMPNVQYGDPAVPYGEAMIHFYGTPIVDELHKLCRFPRWRLHFYAAFLAYTILAYTERSESSPLEEVVAWGGHRPLLELLDEHLEVLKS